MIADAPVKRPVISQMIDLISNGLLLDDIGSDKEAYHQVDNIVAWIQSEFWIPERQHLPENERGLALHPYQSAASLA